MYLCTEHITFIIFVTFNAVFFVEKKNLPYNEPYLFDNTTYTAMIGIT